MEVALGIIENSVATDTARARRVKLYYRLAYVVQLRRGLIKGQSRIKKGLGFESGTYGPDPEINGFKIPLEICIACYHIRLRLSN